MDDPQALLQRRRIWGVPPDAVAAWMAACQRERTDTRAQVAALEIRLSHLAAERDAVTVSVAALKGEIARLEAEKAEWKGRPETIRAEAIQFVVDAYAEAQQAREQVARETTAERAAAHEAIEAERAAVQAEIAGMRRDLEAERRRHEEAIAALRQQQAETLASLDTIGRSLLMQFGRIDAAAGTADAPPDVSAAVAPNNAIADTIPDSVPDAVPELPHVDVPPTLSEPTAAIAMPADNAEAGARRSPPSEDTMLARALDELEAILRGNRKAGAEN